MNRFARADRNLAWTHIAFVGAVSLVLFWISFLAEFIHYRMALLVYWFNIFLIEPTLFWTGATQAGALDGWLSSILQKLMPSSCDSAVVVRHRRGAPFLEYVSSITAMVLV